MESKSENICGDFNDEFERFRERVTSKCSSYRSAVAKDKTKKRELVDALEKDMGSKESVQYAIKAHKDEIESGELISSADIEVETVTYDSAD